MDLDCSTAPEEEEEDEERVAAARFCLRWLFPKGRLPPTPITGAPLVFGRDPGCNVQLLGAQVSRSHAQLDVHGRRVRLRDLGSRNGTFVDGRRVRDEELCLGSVVRIGAWLGLVEVSDSTEVSEALDVAPIAADFYGGAPLRRVMDPARRVAGTDLPIIVVGATGTGKERAARAIHEWSGRQGCFVAINCAALPESLAESELFGHRKGAFTGADREGVGHLRAADGGTLFLDEIADLPLSTQTKLLRAVEQGAVQPVGETRAVQVDFRIVAAAQRPLPEAVARGAFRLDLFTRLNGLSICLPDLNGRTGDIPGLFMHFLREKSAGSPPKVDARLLEQLCLYVWPGNVRELELLTRQLLGLYRHEGRLQCSHLPADFTQARERSEERVPIEIDAGPELGAATSLTRDQQDLALLLASLQDHAGNVARAARRAGISRQRAYRLLAGRPEFDLGLLRRPGSAPAPDDVSH
jgi:transcriptional regulator of acetoin/glycerol metabolism